MASGTVKARIQLKCDTESNWDKARNFIPLKGEIIIYSADESHPFSRLKAGDGTTPVIDLPFIESQSSISLVKYDTTENWNLQRDFVPNEGEIIVYSNKTTLIKDGQEYNEPAIKVGDGTTYLIDLPFVFENMEATITNHINDAVRHITQEERVFWNNKLNL